MKNFTTAYFTDELAIYQNVSSATNYLKPMADQNCVDIELSRDCENYCVEDLSKCINGCKADSVCISYCYREEIECIDACPCHSDCPQGQDFLTYFVNYKMHKF